jgi:hypothetical protein
LASDFDWCVNQGNSVNRNGEKIFWQYFYFLLAITNVNNAISFLFFSGIAKKYMLIEIDCWSVFQFRALKIDSHVRCFGVNLIEKLALALKNRFQNDK